MVIVRTVESPLKEEALSAPADDLSSQSALFCDMQALAEARERAQSASAAAASAEKKLAGLQVAIPKARMEAEAQRHKAQDLQAQLSQLKAATKVRSSSLSELPLNYSWSASRCLQVYDIMAQR